ncbi:MAG: tetratricopeptide repeat protein [Kiritimatiellae bacterium]|nr:tetratricopeptide repeat protein [Kiritimatiellia bacterium]
MLDQWNLYLECFRTGRSRARPIAAAAAALLLLMFTCDAAGGSRRDRQLDELLTNGKAALEDELYELAQQQFEALLKKATRSPERLGEGTVLLARALYGQKKYREQIERLKAVDPAARQTEWVSAMDFWRATAEYEAGLLTDALSTLQGFEDTYPASLYLVQAKRLRIRCCLQAGQKEKAFEQFAAFDAEHGNTPEGPPNLLDWAQALVTAGKVAEARDVLRKLVTAAPETQAARQGYYWLGQILITQRDFPEARSVFTALLALPNLHEDHRARAYYALGRIEEAEGKLEPAVDSLQKGLELSRSPELKNEGLVVLGRLLIKLGKLEEGTARLKAFIASVPNDPLAERIQLELAEYLLDHKDNARAVEEFQLYLETYTRPEGQARALFGKGWALLNLGRNAESAAAFEKAYNLFPDGADDKQKALLKTADAQFAHAQFKTASATYARFLAEFADSPLAPQSEFQAAECAARLGEIDKARKGFAGLAERWAENPLAERALLRMGETAEQQNNLEQAVADYHRVMSTYPDGPLFAQSLCSRGRVHYKLGHFEKALADFGDVVTKFPQSEWAEEAEFRRGNCQLMLGDTAAAAQVWDQFVQKHPASGWTPHVLFSMGNLAYNRQDYENAEKHFVALFEKHPGNALADKALFWAGRVASEQKAYRRAVERFNTLKKHFPASPLIPEARYRQGVALMWLLEYSGAIVLFDEVIKQFPDSYLADHAWLRKGDCQFTLGTHAPERYEEAITSFRVIVDSTKAPLDLKLQAHLWIGRCLEKTNRKDEALHQYLTEVVYKYLTFREEGRRVDGAYWFTRAAISAAGICEAQKKWREAVNIYRHIVDADVPASKDAQERINKIRLENWLLFY